MQEPPILTDRAALARYRERAMRNPNRALFLQHEAAVEIQERLNEVNRRFTAPAIVTPFASVWADLLPGARIVADDETLDLTPGTHDLVIHSLSLHWANDPVGQLVQCRRALRSDGLFLAAMFGGQTLAQLRMVLAEAEIALCGGLSPRVAAMGEIRDLGGLLQRAGFALPVADAAARTVSYRNMFHLMRDLRAMGEVNALSGRRKSTPPRAFFDTATQAYSTAFGTDDGRIPATFETIFLTGWAPDDSQPQPLRRGAATTRLADALNTQETPLPDSAPKRSV